MAKVSIIIPIYNQEKRLGSCLESIKRQSFEDYECILIDDGSTDSSASIAHAYVNCDRRFRYYRIENSGVSVARNLGIKKSTTDLVVFVDSDDSVKENYLSSLVNPMLSNPNIVMNVISSVTSKKGEGVFQIETILQEFNHNYDYRIFNAPWSKCFVKAYINDYFIEGLALGEDLLFVLQYMIENKNKYVRFEKNDIYNYTVENNSTSLSNSTDTKKMDRYLQFFEKLSMLDGKITVAEVVKVQSKSLLIDLINLYEKDSVLVKEWITNNYDFIANCQIRQYYYCVFKILLFNQRSDMWIKALSNIYKIKKFREKK